MFESSETVVIQTFMLLAMVVACAWSSYREMPHFYLHPLVLASLFHFLPSYILPNLFNWQTNSVHELERLLGPEAYYWKNCAMLAVNLSFLSLWAGYRFNMFKGIAKYPGRLIDQYAIYDVGKKPDLLVIVALILMSFLGPIVLIRVGAFGYFSDYQGLRDSQSTAQWVHVLSSCGRLALLVLAITVFSDVKQHRLLWVVLFVFSLSQQVFFGIVGGFKGEVVIPFAIVGLAYYLVRRRIGWTWVAAGAIALVFAFHIIEPLRRDRLKAIDLDNRNVSQVVAFASSSVANTLLEARGESVSSFSVELLFGRSGLTECAALAIDLVDSGRFANSSPPEFVKNLFLIPLNAFIPRFLWPEKTVTDDGQWFTIHGLGRPESMRSSTGYSPQAYFYFCGGYFGVVIGFFVLGAVDRMLVKMLMYKTLGHWIVYFGIIYHVATIDSNVAAAWTGIVRYFPFLVLAQWLVVSKDSLSVSTVPGAAPNSPALANSTPRVRP